MSWFANAQRAEQSAAYERYATAADKTVDSLESQASRDETRGYPADAQARRDKAQAQRKQAQHYRNTANNTRG